ncbi:MAG: recombinase family protein, partial [Chloroflexi bacterium]|nr:recombinase family protein [Chloroflexota bacterium]
VAGAGWSLQQLVKWLGAHVPPIRNAQIWTTNHLRLIVRNPVYKGEFIAHRWVHIRLRANDEHPGEPERQVWRKVQRPPEEWVRVPVPAIVPPDVWEQANRMLDQNKLTASRNGKSQYLLTGLLACAQCEWAYVGKRRPRRKGGQVYYSRSYFCCRGCGETINYPKCGQGSISCRVLETAVWRVVSRVLLEPDILISALEQAYASGPNAELLREIAYLDQQTTETAGEDELLYRAYVAKAFDEAEYAARRQALKERVRQLAEERQKLAARVVSLEKLERTKRCILQVAAAAQAGGWEADPPHAVKKTIIKIVVDKIRVNVREGWFDLNGAARGRYPIHPEATGSIVETSARTDALAPPPSAHDR